MAKIKNNQSKSTSKEESTSFFHEDENQQDKQVNKEERNYDLLSNIWSSLGLNVVMKKDRDKCPLALSSTKLPVHNLSHKYPTKSWGNEKAIPSKNYRNYSTDYLKSVLDTDLWHSTNNSIEKINKFESITPTLTLTADIIKKMKVAKGTEGNEDFIIDVFNGLPSLTKLLSNTDGIKRVWLMSIEGIEHRVVLYVEGDFFQNQLIDYELNLESKVGFHPLGGNIVFFVFNKHTNTELYEDLDQGVELCE